MTKSQEISLAVFWESVGEFCADMGYEIKEWTVSEEDSGEIKVVAETGGVGDEGTAAEVWGRDRALVHIGRRGAMRCFGKGRIRRVTYPHFLSAVCMQRLSYEETYAEWKKRKEGR